MACSSFCMTSILLLSLLILASASDYSGYDSKPKDYEAQKPTEEKEKLPKYDQTPKPEYKQVKPEDHKVKFYPTKPIKYVHPKVLEGKVKILPVKPNNYGQPKPERKEKLIPIKKPDHEQPKTEVKENILPSKPVYETPKPEEGEEKLVPNYTKPYYKEPVPKGKKNILPRTIGVQGLVLCKSGLKNFPIPGAVARITCLAVDEKSHKTTYFSVRSKACDSKGYFYTTIYPPKSLGINYNEWKIKDCKAYLDHSPLETCKFSTDVNNGVTGHLLSSYSILSHNNAKLYSVGPFFYTSEPNYKTPIPNGY